MGKNFFCRIIFIYLVLFSKNILAAPVIDYLNPDKISNTVNSSLYINGHNFDNNSKVFIEPGGPYIRSSIDTPGCANDVQIFQNKAYVADGASGLQIIDIKEGTVIGSINTLAEARGVFVNGSFAYLAYGNGLEINGLQIVNILDPTNPTLAGKIETAEMLSKVFISGDFAYCISYSSTTSSIK